MPCRGNLIFYIIIVVRRLITSSQLSIFIVHAAFTSPLSTDCVHASSVNMFKNKIDKYHHRISAG